MNMLRPQSPKLSVVIPCYNEEQLLPLMQDRLVPALSALGIDWEVIFVDDGSHDRTREIVRRLHQEEPRLKLVALSRNFGHQAALIAGTGTRARRRHRHARCRSAGSAGATGRVPGQMA